MDYLIRKLPYSDAARWVRLPNGEPFRINPDQIVIWVSLAPVLEPITDQTPRFPALLDTGHGHNFSITEEQVCGWAKLDPASLDKLGTKLVNGVWTPLHRVHVWVHRNRVGECDTFDGSPPFCLELDGITISPRGRNSPRIPLLGMRAARLNHLLMRIDPKNLRVSICRNVR